jgi:hypothetical protein
MSMTHAEHASTEAATYGGLVDATGGIVTVVLAIVALAGVHPNVIVPITVIVFGAALLIQGGTMLSEYTRIFSPPAAPLVSGEQFGGSSLSALFLVGAAGIVLGVLALLNISPAQLSAIAVIAFGSALVLSSNSVRHLYLLRSHAPAGAMSGMGNEVVAGEMASGSAGVQMLAGLAAIVLGILAVSGTNPDVLTLAALLVLGATVILTGSTLSGVVQSFMPASTTAARATMP